MNNIQQGNVGGVIIDGVGILIDATATVLPYVPGGAGTVIKSYKAGKNAAKATQSTVKMARGTTTLSSSRAARREVMRREKIPTSQQPRSQSKNASGREYTYDIPKPGGGTQTKSVQQQTKDRSHQEQPHWEAGNVKIRDGQVQHNRYNRPKLENNKSKVNYHE